ncbi:MAG: hypothetical protein JOY77_11050 [Alphaproteobacteria bacterium]|nr:hypothetical protein [Alphaproteobacteria bacterium]MBV9063447.1 hypothetical protein [Alphaproteobacteria bacterium]
MRAYIIGMLCCLAALPPGAALAQDDYGQMRPYDEYRASPPAADRYPERRDTYSEERPRPARPTVAVDFAASNDLVASRLRDLLAYVLRRDGRFAVLRSEETRQEGADLLIDGTVTNYRLSPSSKGRQSADIDLSFELIDATTGAPLGTVTATASESGTAASLSEAPEDFPESALGRAAEDALRLALPKIVHLVKSRPPDNEPDDYAP